MKTEREQQRGAPWEPTRAFRHGRKERGMDSHARGDVRTLFGPVEAEVSLTEVDFAQGEEPAASPRGIPMCLCKGCPDRQCPCPFRLGPALRYDSGGQLGTDHDDSATALIQSSPGERGVKDHARCLLVGSELP